MFDLPSVLLALEGEVVSTGTSMFDGVTINVEPIVTAIKDALPLVLPAVISIVGIRKAISFVIGMIRSA